MPFFINSLLANSELDGYLNNKNLNYQIIKDKKTKSLIVDLLYDENKMIIFRKDKSNNYKKIFDKKLYFCQNSKYSNIQIKRNNGTILIVCSMPNVDSGYLVEYYQFENILKPNSTLNSVNRQYIDIDTDNITSNYIFTPKSNIPNLEDFTHQEFESKYFEDHHYDFKKLNLKNISNLKTIKPQKQSLYSQPPIKTKMYLIKGDKVEILEEQDNWVKILYKGKKDIKVWVPKEAVE